MAKGPLAGLMAARRGQRLSIQPVDKAHFARILRLGGAATRIR
jgi:predicted RNA-binding protein with PUA-like domain